MSGRRVVAVVLPGARVERHGWRASFVVEGESGHRPSGDWPYTAAVGEVPPIFWGPFYEDATRAAVQWNSARGIGPVDAARIIRDALFAPSTAEARGLRCLDRELARSYHFSDRTFDAGAPPSHYSPRRRTGGVQRRAACRRRAAGRVRPRRPRGGVRRRSPPVRQRR